VVQQALLLLTPGIVGPPAVDEVDVRICTAAAWWLWWQRCSSKMWQRYIGGSAEGQKCEAAGCGSCRARKAWVCYKEMYYVMPMHACMDTCVVATAHRMEKEMTPHMPDGQRRASCSWASTAPQCLLLFCASGVAFSSIRSHAHDKCSEHDTILQHGNTAAHTWH
jgi:hypothetical protein